MSDNTLRKARGDELIGTGEQPTPIAAISGGPTPDLDAIMNAAIPAQRISWL
jgi:hypothetical protein